MCCVCRWRWCETAKTLDALFINWICESHDIMSRLVDLSHCQIMCSNRRWSILFSSPFVRNLSLRKSNQSEYFGAFFLNQFIEHVSFFFFPFFKTYYKTFEPIERSLWPTLVLCLNVFALHRVFFFFFLLNALSLFGEAAIRSRLNGFFPFVVLCTNGCLITWHRTRLHTTKLLLYIVVWERLREGDNEYIFTWEWCETMTLIKCSTQTESKRIVNKRWKVNCYEKRKEKHK